MRWSLIATRLPDQLVRVLVADDTVTTGVHVGAVGVLGGGAIEQHAKRDGRRRRSPAPSRD